MTHLSLFSGIGGLDLAAEAAGFCTVGQCEWAGYPTKILEKYWPNVPRWKDIRTLTGGSFYERTGLRTVDIISGGFPCQPFSVAGKQKGKRDERYLWPEMLRIIRELTPRWVVGENVPGILRIAAADIVQDLEREGYHAVVLDFEAAAVGAPHRRERIAFIGNRKSICKHSDCGFQCQIKEISEADAKSRGVCGPISESKPSGKYGEVTCHPNCGGRNRDIGRWKYEIITNRCGWPTEPGVGRVAHGVPHRVDRLKALGNAVVPAQFYPIFAAIMQVEKEAVNDIL